jgi:hypothetical protein
LKQLCAHPSKNQKTDIHPALQHLQHSRKTSNITGPKHSTGRSEPRYPQTTLLPGSASGWNATERSSISLKDQHHLGLRRTYQNPALAPSLFLSQRKRVEQDGPAVSVVWFSPKGSGFKPVCRHSVTCSRPPRARCSLTHIHSSGTCVPRCYVMLSLIHTRISLFEEQKESGAEKVVKLWRQKEFCLNCAFGMGAGPGLTVIGRGHGFTLQTSFIEETFGKGLSFFIWFTSLHSNASRPSTLKHRPIKNKCISI